MQYIGFIVGENEYIVPISMVQEIIKIQPITKLPQAPYYVEGVLNMRGKIITIIDFKKVIGCLSATEAQNIIVISIGKITFGMMIDRITGVLTVEKSQVESAENVVSEGSHIVQGIAKLKDRIVIIIDLKKIVPEQDAHLFEEQVVDVVQISEDKVEVIKQVEGIGGNMLIKEIVDTKDFLQSKGFSPNHPSVAVLDDIVCFMDALVKHNYAEAETCVHKIIGKGQEGLFKELGKLTRMLHDTIKNITTIDLPKVASSDMPAAVSGLHSVIAGTEDAANRTLEIVEHYLNFIREQKKNPNPNLTFCDMDFLGKLEKDLTELLIVQEFQDLTARKLKQVINFLETLENEMIRIIKETGQSIPDGAKFTEDQQVSQQEIDQILSKLGF